MASRLPKSAPPAIDLLSPGLSRLSPPDSLADVIPAANRIAMAVTQHERIDLFADYDVDGSNCIAVWYEALVGHFGVDSELVRLHQGFRLTDGYGLTDKAVDRILAQESRPDLVIVGDCGSADEPRIARLSNAGIDTCVCDHHLIPTDGVPASAFACVTPLREDSTYPDRAICGAVVSWLTACVTRHVLIDIGYLRKCAPNLGGLLPFLALASVADCMDLASSVNNRALIRAGLAAMETSQRPCWQVVRMALGRGRPLTEQDLGFGVGPRINAAGRIETAERGLRFLLSTTTDEALGWWQKLEEQNSERRAIERRLIEAADPIARRQVRNGRAGLVIYLNDGHPGVQGIVAQRLMQKYGRPVVCLSPKVGSEALVSGSARSAHGVNIKEAFDYVAAHSKDVVTHHGGHAAAGGCELVGRGRALNRFIDLFDEAVRKVVDGQTLGPVIRTDGALEPAKFTPDLLHELEVLRPFGKGFEAPLFESQLTIKSVRTMGDGSHLRVAFEELHDVSGVWFSAIKSGSALPCASGDTRRVLYGIEDNYFNGQHRLQMHVSLMLDAPVT